jgi:hypothetical protein
MQDDNIVDFIFHQEKSSDFPLQKPLLSEDLCVAIEVLIQRLRDNNPIPQVS